MMKSVFAFVIILLMMVSPSVLAKVSIVLEIDDIPNMGQRKDRDKELPWRVSRFASDNSVTVVAKLEESPGLTNITLVWTVEVDGEPVAIFGKDGKPVPNNTTKGPVVNHEVRFQVSSEKAAYFEIDAEADYSSGYSTANADLEIIGDFQLKAVTFDSEADKGGHYDQGKHFYEIVQDIEKKTYRHNKKKKDPHWLDENLDGIADNKKNGENKYPVAIRRSHDKEDVYLVAGAEIVISKEVKEFKKKIVHVKATGPIGEQLPAHKAKVVGNKIILDPVKFKEKVKDEIQYYSEATYRWELSLDGGETWEYIGSSRNPFYVTWDKPIAKSAGYNMYHTYIHIGCVGAEGNGNVKKIKVLRAIFDNGGFATLDVKTVEGKKPVFYEKWRGKFSESAEELVTNGPRNSMCSTLADMFVKVYETQGISYKNEYAVIRPNTNMAFNTNPGGAIKVATHMMIKNWKFNKPIMSARFKKIYNINATHMKVQQQLKNDIEKKRDTHPYAHNATTSIWEFRWSKPSVLGDVDDEIGIPGMGKSSQKNPLSLFSWHVLVKINLNGGEFEYFDPSYGIRKIGSLKEYENDYISAYVYKERTVNKSGKILDLFFIVPNNPIGPQISEKLLDTIEGL